MKRYIARKSGLLASVMLLASAALLPSCNSKDAEEEPTYDNVPSVAVNSFRLQADTKVMTGLDSVFFSIDLENGVIFNADSLPKGTDVSGLLATITYPTTVTSAEIRMEGGKKHTGVINYLQNPSDTLDFTGRVTLTLKSGDGLARSYRLKVNVHQEKSDSLTWDKEPVGKLPARNANPRAQKTVKLGEKTVSLIEEADGSFTLATNPDITGTNGWTLQTPAFPSNSVNAATLTACDNSLFILDSDGYLLVSDNGTAWRATGRRWANILGAYDSHLLGLRLSSDGRYLHTQYTPASPGVTPEESIADSAFPVRGFSAMGTVSSRWADTPTAIICGGITASGTYTGATWGYDGTNWAEISNRPLPAGSGWVLVHYYVERQGTSQMGASEHEAWLAFGGLTPQNEIIRRCWISYDNGVNWSRGPVSMTVPEKMPAFTDADAIVIGSRRSADLADSWKKTRRHERPYETVGDMVYWDCPYIYVFGGVMANGKLSTDIRRAVLNSLTFRPLF